MKLVQYPKNTSMSGQACVAMLLGLSLDQAIELVGHRRRMSTRELVGALLPTAHVAAGARRTPSRGYHPERCLLYAVPHGKSRAGHWMVHWDGQTFDPREDQTDHVIVSFLPLESPC